MKQTHPQRRVLVVIGSIICQFCVGMLYSWSVFQTPISQMFGWDTGAVSLTFSISTFMLPVAMIGRRVAAAPPGTQMGCISGRHHPRHRAFDRQPIPLSGHAVRRLWIPGRRGRWPGLWCPHCHLCRLVPREHRADHRSCRRWLRSWFQCLCAHCHEPHQPYWSYEYISGAGVRLFRRHFAGKPAAQGPSIHSGGSGRTDGQLYARRQAAHLGSTGFS